MHWMVWWRQQPFFFALGFAASLSSDPFLELYAFCEEAIYPH